MATAGLIRNEKQMVEELGTGAAENILTAET